MNTTHSFIARTLTALAASLALLTATASAQLVADGQTNIISGGVTTVGGPLTVGTNGDSTLLIINNSGIVANSSATIGGGGNSNTVIVSNPGSFWTNSGQLIVGFDGAFNRLIVTNGARVASASGIIGRGGMSNSVLVTGAGSLWTNSSFLRIGDFFGSHQLVVTDGGQVSVSNAVFLGVNFAPAAGYSAAGNSVLAIGGTLDSRGLTLGGTNSINNNVTLLSGSTWNLRGSTLTWGIAANGNTITIDATSALTNIGNLVLGENNTVFYMTNSAGGYALNDFTTNQFQFVSNRLASLTVGNARSVGTQLVISNYALTTSGASTIGSGATNAAVLVTGTGAVWNSLNTITLGASGASTSGNQLTVSNGATVTATGLATSGGPSATANIVRVSDGFLTVTNAAVGGRLDVRRGSLIFNGGSINADRLVITNVAGVMQFNNGIFRTRGLTNINGSAFVVGNGSGSASLILEGTNGHFLSAGLTVRSNATVFLNGGMVTSALGLSIQSGGRLQAGTNDALATGTPVFLVGGTFALEGNTQGPSLGGLSQTAESIVDFGPLGTAQILSFSDLAAHAAGNLLHISNWEGTPGIGGGTDEFLITTTNSVTAAFLADVQFEGYAPGAILLSTGELVPVGVPEPATVVLVGLGAAVLLVRGRSVYRRTASAGTTTQRSPTRQSSDTPRLR